MLRGLTGSFFSLLVGCGAIHGASDDAGADAGVADAAFVDAAFVDADAAGADADVPDAGPGIDYGWLVAVSDVGREAVLHSVEREGITSEIARVPLNEDESSRSYRGGPDPAFGLLTTASPRGRFVSLRPRLLSFDDAREIDVLASVNAADPGGPCADAAPHVRVRFSAEGRGLFVSCMVLDGIATTGGRAYHVDSFGAVQRFGGACTSLGVTTSDGGALTFQADTCDGPFVATWVSPRASDSSPVTGLGPRDLVHYADPASDDWIVSTRVDRTPAFELQDLRRISRDGRDPRVLAATLPFVALVLALSDDGRQLVIGTREPEIGVFTAFTVHDLDDGSRTEVALDRCSTTVGLPSQTAWSPDGSAFLVGCHEAVFVVRGATPLALEPTPDGARPLATEWSTDSTTLLRTRVDGWDLHDPVTGSARPLPASVDALSPTIVTWRARPRRPDCGTLTGC